MRLRKIKLKDLTLMLEWMHDVSVTEKLKTDFSSKTKEDCEAFIRSSWNDKSNLHLAIVSDEDIRLKTLGRLGMAGRLLRIMKRLQVI